jgi:hypothetical protein
LLRAAYKAAESSVGKPEHEAALRQALHEAAEELEGLSEDGD